MNKKKLSRLLEPNLKLYFVCMIVFAAATATVSLALGLVEIACTVGLYAYFTKRNQSRRQNILQYIDNVTGSVDTASKSTLINSPLPIMVFRPDTGEVIWSNENLLQLAGVREHLFEMKVEDAVPDFPVQWLLEGKQECPDRVVMNSRRFRVYGSLVRAKGRGAEQNLVATTYWVDTTEADDLRERYTATRPVLAILMVDNYEDLMKACADTQRSAVLAQIDEKLNNWAAPPSPSASARTPTPWRSCTATPASAWRWPSAGAATRRWSGGRWTSSSTAAAASPRKSGRR